MQRTLNRIKYMTYGEQNISIVNRLYDFFEEYNSKFARADKYMDMFLKDLELPLTNFRSELCML